MMRLLWFIVNVLMHSQAIIDADRTESHVTIYNSKGESESPDISKCVSLLNDTRFDKNIAKMELHETRCVTGFRDYDCLDEVGRKGLHSNTTNETALWLKLVSSMEICKGNPQEQLGFQDIIIINNESSSTEASSTETLNSITIGSKDSDKGIFGTYSDLISSFFILNGIYKPGVSGIEALRNETYIDVVTSNKVSSSLASSTASINEAFSAAPFTTDATSSEIFNEDSPTSETTPVEVSRAHNLIHEAFSTETTNKAASTTESITTDASSSEISNNNAVSSETTTTFSSEHSNSETFQTQLIITTSSPSSEHQENSSQKTVTTKMALVPETENIPGENSGLKITVGVIAAVLLIIFGTMVYAYNQIQRHRRGNPGNLGPTPSTGVPPERLDIEKRNYD